MFGYVTTNIRELSKEQKERFRSVYCGVCSELSALSGARGRLTLTYEATFLALILNALYEPSEKTDERTCSMHPFKKRSQITNEITAYAARINIILFYYSMLDGWTDDKSIIKKKISDYLKAAFDKASVLESEKAHIIEESLRHLSEMENARLNDIDAAAGCFGNLLGEVFVYKNDNWSPLLRQMGDTLGRFIYICDAWEDTKKDAKSGAYNPLLTIINEPDYETRVYDMLKLEMAACADAFEKLPIVKDIDILRNIIYSGVWCKYSAKRGQPKAGEDNR